ANNGLGTARGPRPRKRPCASFPTLHFQFSLSSLSPHPSLIRLPLMKTVTGVQESSPLRVSEPFNCAVCIGARRATGSAVARRQGIEAPPNQCVGNALRVHNDRMVRQVKGARDNCGVARGILLAAAALWAAVADFAQGA